MPSSGQTPLSRDSLMAVYAKRMSKAPARRNRKDEAMKLKGFLLSAAFYCMLLAGPVLAAQGTDGTELKALDAQTLTIRLGPAWAGAQFQLRTDVGVYPGTVSVGEDGVLHM